jgi:hypothetical protein
MQTSTERSAVSKYILGSSQGNATEKALIEKINKRGGAGYLITWIHIDGCLALGGLLLAFVAWTPQWKLIGTAVAILAIAWYFWRGHKVYKPIMNHVWHTTDNPDLIALDKEWQAVVATEDPAWRGAIDQARFVRVRQLAGMSHDEAAPLILAERRKLNPSKFPPEGSQDSK